MREPGRGGLGGAQRVASPSLGGAGGGLAGDAQCLGDGGESVALCLQAWDGLVEGGDGLGPVAAAVVEHDDAGFDGPGDGGDAGAAPVVGVVVGEDEQVAGCVAAPGGVVGGGERVGPGGVGQAQQGRLRSGGGGEGVAGERDFGVEFPAGGVAGVDVGERV